MSNLVKQYSGKVIESKKKSINPFDEIFETADKSRKAPSKTFSKNAPKSIFGNM